MQKLLNKLSAIFFQHFYSKLCGNIKNVSGRILINSGVYCIPKRPNEEPTISTICLCFYSKVTRKSSVQFRWEEIYVYIYLIFAEMYCKGKEQGKRLNKQKVIWKGYIKYVFYPKSLSPSSFALVVYVTLNHV